MDLECRDTPLKPKMHLGQQRTGKAHSEKGSEEGQNLSQKEIEHVSGRANEPEEDDEQCFAGNSESPYIAETGSGIGNRPFFQSGGMTCCRGRKSSRGVCAWLV